MGRSPDSLKSTSNERLTIWTIQGFSPERFAFLILSLKVGEAGLESVDLFDAHGLVLVELAHTLNDAHHLVHAGLRPALCRGVAHEVLQAERKPLNEGHLIIEDSLPATTRPSQQVLSFLVDIRTESETGCA